MELHAVRPQIRTINVYDRALLSMFNHCMIVNIPVIMLGTHLSTLQDVKRDVLRIGTFMGPLAQPPAVNVTQVGILKLPQ